MTTSVFLTIFFVMFFYDVIWARYAVDASKEDLIMTPFWAGTMPFFIAYFSREYVNSYEAAIPASLGAIAGTYVSLKYLKKLSFFKGN